MTRSHPNKLHTYGLPCLAIPRLTVRVHVHTHVAVVSCLFLPSVTQYITLFKLKNIHLALKKINRNVHMLKNHYSFLLTWTKYSRESKGSRTCSIRRAISSCLTSLSWFTHAITASNTFQKTNKCKSLDLQIHDYESITMSPKIAFTLLQFLM